MYCLLSLDVWVVILLILLAQLLNIYTAIKKNCLHCKSYKFTVDNLHYQQVQCTACWLCHTQKMIVTALWLSWRYNYLKSYLASSRISKLSNSLDLISWIESISWIDDSGQQLYLWEMYRGTSPTDIIADLIPSVSELRKPIGGSVTRLQFKKEVIWQ